MKMRKAFVAVICAGVLALGTAGTVAYFTDSERATNTFTVGHVEITLDEAKVNADGTVVEGADRVTENEYHLLPGHTYVKDPTVTVIEGSGESYVRMLVEVKGLDKLKEALPDEGATAKYYADGEDGSRVFLLQNLVEGWASNVWAFESCEDSGTSGVYEFRYAGTADGFDDDGEKCSAQLPALFTHITISGDDVDFDNIDKLAGVEVVVTAHAIQAAGFANADAAWTAFDGQHLNV